MFKIVLVAALLVSGLVYAKQSHALYRARVLGSCEEIAAPTTRDTGQWWACHEGIFTGYPELSLDHCDRVGRLPGREIWRCTIPLDGSPVVV